MIGKTLLTTFKADIIISLERVMKHKTRLKQIKTLLTTDSECITIDSTRLMTVNLFKTPLQSITKN